jgi:hypothetical protein
MGAECIMDLLARIDLDHCLINCVTSTTSKQRKTEALKDYKLNLSVSLT